MFEDPGDGRNECNTLRCEAGNVRLLKSRNFMSLVKFFKVQSQMTRRDEMTNHFTLKIIKQLLLYLT